MTDQACEILVDPICEACRTLISGFNPEFQDRLRNNILLAGGGTMGGLNPRVERGLADLGTVQVNVVDEPGLRRRQRRPVAGGRHAGRVLAAAEVT